MMVLNIKTQVVVERNYEWRKKTILYKCNSVGREELTLCASHNHMFLDGNCWEEKNSLLGLHISHLVAPAIAESFGLFQLCVLPHDLF